MFSESSKNKQSNQSLSGQNIISAGSTIKGDLIAQGDFRIDGTIEGNINTTGKVVVGKTGHVSGNIKAKDAYVEGKCDGSLELSGTLTLKSSAEINGEVHTSKLSVEPGATFNVNCAMGAKVQTLKNEKTVGAKA